MKNDNNLTLYISLFNSGFKLMHFPTYVDVVCSSPVDYNNVNNDYEGTGLQILHKYCSSFL